MHSKRGLCTQAHRHTDLRPIQCALRRLPQLSSNQDKILIHRACQRRKLDLRVLFHRGPPG